MWDIRKDCNKNVDIESTKQRTFAHVTKLDHTIRLLVLVRISLNYV